jgi:hypothetical protein
MPRGSVRCRYCHAPLTTEASSSSLPTSPVPIIELEVVKPPPASDVAAPTTGSTRPSSDTSKSSNQQKASEKASADLAERLKARKVAQSTGDAVQRPIKTDAASKPSDVPPEKSPRQKPEAAKVAPAAFSPPNIYASRHCLITLCLTLLLLAAPLCVSGPVPGAKTSISFGLPMVHSGDEPHNLVLINSLISDGDLNVRNNYQNAHQGGNQAGRKFAGWAIDHHVSWYWRSHFIRWWQAFEMDRHRWNKDAQGHPVPTLQKDSVHRPVNRREYSTHSPGLALLMSPFVVVFRNTQFVEPAALLCSCLVTILGLLAFMDLIRPYQPASFYVLAAGMTAYLGSPLWHYGRTLYVESFLACFAIAAYAAVLRHNRYLLAGLLIAAGVLLKSPFFLFAVPLVVEALVRRNWEQAYRCTVPILLSFGIVLLWNKKMHGEWLKFPDHAEWGNVTEGMLGLTFSWQHGLLLFSPIVLLGVIALPEWFRRNRRDAILMTSAAALYYCAIASRQGWWGGACYSARLILPIIPFLFAPLVVLFDTKLWRRDWRLRLGTGMVIAVSVLFGVIGAFGCEHVWGRHPLQFVLFTSR